MAECLLKTFGQRLSHHLETLSMKFIPMEWIIRFFHLNSPMALDTASCPLTLHVPHFITWPPKSSILFFSSCKTAKLK